MKAFSLRKAILVSALALSVPLSALAAFNDVTLETTAIIDVGGYELTISGSSAVIEEIVVDTLDFTVTLQNGSSITVASADRVDFAYDVAAQTTTETCGATESTLTLSVASAGATTVVVTPSGECVEEVSEPEPSGGSSSRGTSSVRRDPADLDASNSNARILEELLAQIRTIVTQIVALGGTVSPEILALVGEGSGGSVYTRDLDVGAEGADVRALQEFLIAQNKGPAATALADWGSTDYFGELTRAALAEFQAAQGITPAVGYFGPKTRTLIQSL